jgi:1-aminocyclopropane-1-carboxylate deaminase
MKLDSFDRYPLLFGPSPLHPLERLSSQFGGARIWAKREDCNSGLAFGGNKVRKLEYLVAEAIAQGCDTLVSIGGVQSNHTRQVAAVSARVGMKCVLIQESWVDWPDAVYGRVGNILLSRILGADVRLVSATFGIGFKESWERALAEIRVSGGKPYAIPAGASDHRLGGLGFARWAQEVAQQERELGVFFDTVVVCSVTGSTQAGMIAGFAAQDRPRRIIGIDASAKAKETHEQVARIARQTADLIGIGRNLRDNEIILDARLPRGHLRDPRRPHPGSDPARGAPRGHDHGPRLRGEVHGGAHRPRVQRRDRKGLDRALCPPRRPAGTERVQLALPLICEPPPGCLPVGRRDVNPRPLA